MKSLQCEQNVGCFKLVAINLCSFTIWTLRLTAPRRLLSSPWRSVNSRAAKPTPGAGLALDGDCCPAGRGLAPWCAPAASMVGRGLEAGVGEAEGVLAEVGCGCCCWESILGSRLEGSFRAMEELPESLLLAQILKQMPTVFGTLADTLVFIWNKGVRLCSVPSKIDWLSCRRAPVQIQFRALNLNYLLPHSNWRLSSCRSSRLLAPREPLFCGLQ